MRFQSSGVFTAHEALHLGYESAQTRRVPRRPGYFNLSTHFPWAGLRTNQPDGAHMEYLRGIENPIGIKIGQGTTHDDIARWLIDHAMAPVWEANNVWLIFVFIIWWTMFSGRKKGERRED